MSENWNVPFEKISWVVSIKAEKHKDENRVISNVLALFSFLSNVKAQSNPNGKNIAILPITW